MVPPPDDTPDAPRQTRHALRDAFLQQTRQPIETWPAWVIEVQDRAVRAAAGTGYDAAAARLLARLDALDAPPADHLMAGLLSLWRGVLLKHLLREDEARALAEAGIAAVIRAAEALADAADLPTLPLALDAADRVHPLSPDRAGLTAAALGAFTRLLGPQAEDTLLMAERHAARQSAEDPELVPLLTRVFQLTRDRLGPDDPLTQAREMAALRAAWLPEHLPAATARLRELVDARAAARGDADPDTRVALRALADALRYAESPEAAVVRMRLLAALDAATAVEPRQRAVGWAQLYKDHIAVGAVDAAAQALRNGLAVIAQDDTPEADLLRDALRSALIALLQEIAPGGEEEVALRAAREAAWVALRPPGR